MYTIGPDIMLVDLRLRNCRVTASVGELSTILPCVGACQGRSEMPRRSHIISLKHHKGPAKCISGLASSTLPHSGSICFGRRLFLCFERFILDKPDLPLHLIVSP